jgi:hypothetical protein
MGPVGRLCGAILGIAVTTVSQPIFPEKMTYMNPTPRLAETFVNKYFGFHFRLFDFDTHKESCADITWLQLCQTSEVRTFKETVWNWEWGIHFVNTKRHPQGPMNITTWKAHLHSRVGAMQAYNEWMQAHSAYFARSLTDLAAALARDGVPFFVSYRTDDSAHTGTGTGTGTGANENTAPRVRVLWSLWLEVPTGIIWEVSSFDLAAEFTAAASPLARPCDAPFASVPSLAAAASPAGADNERWYEQWGAVSPNPRDFVAYYEGRFAA